LTGISNCRRHSNSLLQARKLGFPGIWSGRNCIHLGSLTPRLPAQVEFVQMDTRHIPALDVFDLAFDVIKHIADDERVLRGMRAATRKGGGIIVAVPQHPWLWSRSDDVAYLPAAIPPRRTGSKISP
jgi:hypothetical protein